MGSRSIVQVIMALGFTGAVRLGQEKPDNRALLLGILGCNIAWGIVDGIIYLLLDGAAAGAVVVLATLPIIVPYLLFRNPHIAVRVSHLTGVTLLFLPGVAWGKTAGGSPFWIGAGMALAGVTILLGG